MSHLNNGRSYAVFSLIFAVAVVSLINWQPASSHSTTSSRPTPTQGRQTPDLRGTYALETVTPCKIIKEKIEATIKGMSIYKDEARSKFLDGNLPAPRMIKISYTSSEVTIGSLPSGPMTTPLNGRFVKARRDAEDIEIGTKWEKGKLQRTFRNDEGQRINAYSLRADGKLVMDVTAEPRSRFKRYLSGTLKYELVYSRTAADDNDIAYQKYPDCQEDSKRKGRIVITSAAEQAKKMLTQELDDLHARRMAHARKGYDPREIIRAIKESKESLLTDLAGREGFGGLGAYMERTVIIPTVIQLADPDSGLVSKETLERFKSETLASLHFAIVNANPFSIYVCSQPPEATFEIETRQDEHWFITTNSQLPPLYAGDYKYKVTKAGFKDAAVPPFPISLLRTIERLECKLIKETDPQAAQPCKMIFATP